MTHLLSSYTIETNSVIDGLTKDIKHWDFVSYKYYTTQLFTILTITGDLLILNCYLAASAR